jgi:ribose 5-phosphate isomerase A
MPEDTDASVPLPADRLGAMKRAAAEAALRWVEPGAVIGVGTGSTVAHLIDAMAALELGPAAAVASSIETARRLELAGIRVVPLDDALPLGVYIDGADEVDPFGRSIKGGGGAHVREKVLATAAATFVCIVDEAKLAAALGDVPLPLEVLPMARSFVTAQVEDLGGVVTWRETFVTDNANYVLDVRGLDLSEPGVLEVELEAIPGVIGCGLFARRIADVVVIGRRDGTTAILPMTGPAD